MCRQVVLHRQQMSSAIWWVLNCVWCAVTGHQDDTMVRSVVRDAKDSSSDRYANNWPINAVARWTARSRNIIEIDASIVACKSVWLAEWEVIVLETHSIVVQLNSIWWKKYYNFFVAVQHERKPLLDKKEAAATGNSGTADPNNPFGSAVNSGTTVKPFAGNNLSSMFPVGLSFAELTSTLAQRGSEFKMARINPFRN